MVPEEFFFGGDKQEDIGNYEEAYKLFYQGALPGESLC